MTEKLPSLPFWFIRHGQTDYNLAGLAQGLLDIDLNQTGRAQAEQAGPLLQNRGITEIICSPMRRTCETADILNRFLGLPISYEPDLREASFGDQEGVPIHPWFTEWVDGLYTPPKGESFPMLTARVASALCRVLPTRKAPVLIVAHGGVFRAIRAVMGLPRETKTGNAVPLYCQPAQQGWKISEAEPEAVTG